MARLFSARGLVDLYLELLLRADALTGVFDGRTVTSP